MCGRSTIVEHVSTISEILKVVVRVTKMNVTDRLSVQPVFVFQVGKNPRSQHALWNHPESDPRDMRPVYSGVRHSLQRMPVCRPLEPATKTAQGLVGGTGMNHVSMQENPVLNPCRKLVPLQIFVTGLELVQSLHVWRDCVMIAQNHLEATPRGAVQQLLEKPHGGIDGTTEDAVLRPLEIKNVPVQDEDPRGRGGVLYAGQILGRPGVVTEQVQVRNR